DPIQLALELQQGHAGGGLLDAAEALVMSRKAPRALGLTLGRALKLRGELGRSLAVLTALDDEESLAEAADVARRAADPDRARALIARAGTASCPPAVRARLAAVEARLEIDAGAPERALAVLQGAIDTFASLEMRAYAAFR